MLWGYQYAPYYEYGVRLPVDYDINSHCHALIAGASGSGKSMAVLWLMGRLLKSMGDDISTSDDTEKGCSVPGLTLYVCDFKNSEDFAFLRGYAHYYAGEDVYQGMMDYYGAFRQARQDGHCPDRYLLIFDEYQSAVNYFQAKDKSRKSHMANDILSANAELLMMGRALRYSVWTIVQYATSDLFKGARLNYMLLLALGRSPKEQLTMLFSGEEIPQNRVYRPGEGLLLADGHALQEIKFPLISDREDWKRHIQAILTGYTTRQRAGGMARR